MKRKLSTLVAVAGFVLLAISMISIAQPVNPSGGMTRVQTEVGGGLQGSGTTTNKLKIRTDCSTNDGIKWDGDSWECGAAGISGTGAPNKLTKWTGASSIGADDQVTHVNTVAGNGVVGINAQATGEYTPVGLNEPTYLLKLSNQQACDGLSCGETYSVDPYALWVSDGKSKFDTPILANDDVTFGDAVGDDVSVIGTARFYANATTTFDAHISVLGNSTLGNASADTLTINATTSHTAPTTVQDFRGTIISQTPSSSQNDWNPAGLATATTIVAAPSGSTDLTGLQGGSAGRRIRIYNDGSATINIFHNSGSSSAGNKFALTSPVSSKPLSGNRGCAIDFEYRGTFWYEVGFSCSVQTLESITTTASANLAGSTTVQDFRGTRVSQSWGSSPQNDYALSATATILRATPSTTVFLNGMTGGVDGRWLIIENACGSGNLLYLRHDNSGSTSTNRLYSSYGEDELMEECYSAGLYYDGTQGRWMIKWKNGRFKNSGLFQGGVTAYLGINIYGDSILGDGPEDDFVMTNGATITTGDTRGAAISPSSISGNVDNWAPTDLDEARVIYVTASSAATIRGLTGGTAGRFLTLCNVGSNDVVIQHDDGASSTAANRFYMPAAANLTLPQTGTWNPNARECVELLYNGASSRWTVNAVGGSSRAYQQVTSRLEVSGGAFFTNANNDLGDATGDFFNLKGRIYTHGTAPSLSSCGTSPSIVGNDKAGQVTMGTGSPSACTITFTTGWSTNPPICVLTPYANVATFIASLTTTVLTVNLSAGTSSHVFNYRCEGRL